MKQSMILRKFKVSGPRFQIKPLNFEHTHAKFHASLA